MAASIDFFAGEGFAINNLSGSGLGFFGSGGFGRSVAVGQFQGRTFITNAAGTDQGPETDNVKFLNASSGILGQVGSGVALLNIPNFQSTLNIRFTNDIAVNVQNAQLRIFDRVNINNPASGVTTKAAEIIHPSLLQTEAGSGDSIWATPAGSSFLPAVDSPGTSGLSPNGPATTDARHDWFFALSASPDSIGSKTEYGAFFSIEFL